MNPVTGEVISAEELDYLRTTHPHKAAKFSVRLEGTEEDVERIASAVRTAHQAKQRAANRAANKRARAARKAGRR